MRRHRQFITIATSVGLFAAAAITGFGGWPVLIVAGVICVALVDGACRALDRDSKATSRGNFMLETEPTVEVLRPAMRSDQAA